MRQDPRTARSGRKALIALGSNAVSPFGDVRVTVQKSMSLVAERLGSPAECSSLYLTPAFPAGAGPDFVNAAMTVTTDLDPQEVLGILHDIEAAAGRVREVRWGPRTLDLDLIGLGDVIAPDAATYASWRDLSAEDQARIAPEETILPHPRVQDRAFVLVPLAEIAADWVHPVMGKTVREMLAACDQKDVAQVRPIVSD